MPLGTIILPAVQTPLFCLCSPPCVTSTSAHAATLYDTPYRLESKIDRFLAVSYHQVRCGRTPAVFSRWVALVLKGDVHPACSFPSLVTADAHGAVFAARHGRCGSMACHNGRS
ncbi:hypothetical protein FKP32DRAFT_668179 [Trametes sanguinea]|nr:hypothetical protein FKP32DRAFT_668179 [Trametes sanguinea]